MLVAGSVQTGSLSSAASTLPQFGTDVSPLNVNIQYITSNIVRVKIGAAGRWEVPASLFNVTAPTGKLVSSEAAQQSCPLVALLQLSVEFAPCNHPGLCCQHHSVC